MADTPISHACWDDNTQQPFHWPRVDYDIGRGVCSCCDDLVSGRDAGNRELQVPVEIAVFDIRA
jgi:hypothetical protein